MTADFPTDVYDLAATLDGGQAFRWRPVEAGWEGVVQGRWVRLEPHPGGLRARTAVPVDEWSWLTAYLGLDTNLAAVLSTFPSDPHLQAAQAACRGLHLLRQDPWECLASFILSSTKQIVQIQQCVALLCDRWGESVEVPPGHPSVSAFPTFTRLADASEVELRTCKLGFRAKYLLGTAQALRSGELDLDELAGLPTPLARDALTRLPGVGPKIADCVLLFAYGRQDAFPVDVWILRALQDLYFPRRRPHPGRLRQFTASYFGPHAGYAQQYLFHYVRNHLGRPDRAPRRPTALS